MGNALPNPNARGEILRKKTQPSCLLSPQTQQFLSGSGKSDQALVLLVLVALTHILSVGSFLGREVVRPWL